jgi:hypothetical protein
MFPTFLDTLINFGSLLQAHRGSRFGGGRLYHLPLSSVDNRL